MFFELEASRHELSRALGTVKRAVRRKVVFDVIISFDAGKLRISGLGVVAELPASGQADGEVHIGSDIILRLVKNLPPVDPMPIAASENVLQLGPLSIPCKMLPQQQAPVQLPVNFGLKDLLALQCHHPQEEIEKSGYAKVHQEAKEQAMKMIDKASSALKPLGVTAADITSLVDQCIRRYADLNSQRRG